MGIVVGIISVIVMLFRAFIQLFVELFSVLLFLLSTMNTGHLIVFVVTTFVWVKFKGE